MYGLTLEDWTRVVKFGKPEDWDEWAPEEKLSWALALKDLDSGEMT